MARDTPPEDDDGLPPMPSEVNPSLRDKDGKVWLTIGEAANVAKCDPSTIDRWRKKRDMVRRLFGKPYVYRPRLLHGE